MPIEIKELYIKINVNDDKQSSASAKAKPEEKKDKIIEACIEEMVAIHKQKQER